MSQYETTTLTPGERQTKMTTEESNDNIDPNSPNYQGNQKKPSILGKLKDKTKKAGSKFKSRVGKKKNADGTPVTPTGAAGEEEDDEEEDSTSDDSPSPSPAGVQTTPYTGPASVPREFGTYPSQGKSKESIDEPIGADVTGLGGFNDSDKSETQQPSATDKAYGASEGAKDTMYGGAAATAGALGYDRRDEKPVTEKASDASSDAAGTAEMLGRGGYNRAGEAKDTVAEKGSRAADQTKDAAYETKDAAQAKAADLNNATDDTQTYTEKATNAAVAAKDTVAEKLGVNQAPSEGPSMVDKAKGYFGSATDTTKAKTGAGLDTSKGYTGNAYDNTASAAQGATDTTKEYATRAKDSVTDAATPKNEHKDLSEKITEGLAGLTAPANTPTSGTPRDETNPGILGKLTGMLGYGQSKGPDDHPDNAATHPPTTSTSSTTANQ